MPKISLIVALARNRVIGLNNALPWHLPEDLKHFKQITLGKPVIMGRKTWDSLPEKFRPLPGRRNIVVSRNTTLSLAGAEIAHSLEDACRSLTLDDEAFVIGGAELYRLALPMADHLYLTEIEATIAGDAYFPTWPPNEWSERERLPGVSANGLKYAFVRIDRTNPAGG